MAGLPDFQKYATLRGPAPCTRWVAAVGGCFDSASAKTAVSARLAPTCRVRGGPQDPTHSVEGPVGPCLPDPVTHPQKPESVLGWGGAHKTPFWMLRGISIWFPILCSNLVPIVFLFCVRFMFPIISVLLLGSIFDPVRGAGGEDRTKPKHGK